MLIPFLPRSLLRTLLNGGLVAFFVFGGVVNLFPPDAIRHDYARWGYPDWFHRVTGGLELLSAALLAMPRSRAIGRACAAAVMLGALATLLAHGEYGHAVAPAIILLTLMTSQHLDAKAREARWEGRAF